MSDGKNFVALQSLRDFLPAPRRDSSIYRAWKRAILVQRPICEGCNVLPSRIVAHLVQPILGGGLMDPANVRCLCKSCDRDYNRSNPVVRRRKPKRT